MMANGITGMAKIGFGHFLGGTVWRPGNNLYGILPMILASICVTAGAIVIGVPVGLLTAIFMACFCPERLYRFLKPGVDLLAGIPSVVYGFFGLQVVVPIIRSTAGGAGACMLAACIILGVMMAVIMVAGNQAVIPGGLFMGLRTMTANIVLEMGYASGLHREALIATAAVLFVFILLINLGFNLLKRRDDRR